MLTEGDEVGRNDKGRVTVTGHPPLVASSLAAAIAGRALLALGTSLTAGRQHEPSPWPRARPRAS